jgi:hypothetical protein
MKIAVTEEALSQWGKCYSSDMLISDSRELNSLCTPIQNIIAELVNKAGDSSLS